MQTRSEIAAWQDDGIWIEPHLVGTIKFMECTKFGGMRQPVFKGFREDKLPEECIINV